jgi:uncharacterized membrane protein
MKKILKRLRNGKVLLSVASGILLILVNTGVIAADALDQYNVIINTVLSVLVALGVVSNPETPLKKKKTE